MATTRGQQQRSVETRAALILAAGKVFSRFTYAEARLKDISEEAQVSPGSMYFHFGNKEDFAIAVLQTEHDRMTAVMNTVAHESGDGLSQLLSLGRGLALLIATDPVVQGGIKLSTQPGTGLDGRAKAPYFEWITITEALLRTGIEDGSVDPTIDVASSAQFLNEAFIGRQMLAELTDSWASLPTAMADITPHVMRLIANPARPTLLPKEPA